MNADYIKDNIDKMLECLLEKEGVTCKKCNTCNDVDACCFLMDAVFIVHVKENRKAKSA